MLTKIDMFSLLNKIFESGLLQEIVLLKEHILMLKKCDNKINVEGQIENENRKI
jgi:hypothetical protein